MRCTDEGEHESALAAALMNDLTFVLVAGKNLEGRATAQNNAALVNLSATQALVGTILGKQLPVIQSAAQRNQNQKPTNKQKKVLFSED